MTDSSRWRICCLHRLGNNISNYELISLESPTEVTFGRTVSNNIVLDEAPSISRFHSVMRKESGNWTVTDLKSCNGVIVNGTPITPLVARTLQDKDIIEFGKDVSNSAPAVYRFQFFKAAKVKVKPQDVGGPCSYLNPKTSEICAFPPVKKARENGQLVGSPILVRQKLAEQERLLREEMEQREQEMQKRLEELQSTLSEKEAEKENVLKQMVDYKEKMEVELSHQREHESKLTSEKEEAMRIIKESEKKAEERVLELEAKLQTSLHQSQEVVEQLRLEKDRIATALQKEKEMMEEEIQKKDGVLQELAQEKEGALKGLQQQLEDRQRKEADMSAILEKMRQEREGMQRQMEEQKESLEKEKEQLTVEMQERMNQELQEQEHMLRDELEDQIASLIVEKQNVQKNLKSEMEKAIANKDKELEKELRQKQKELAEAIAKKEEEQEALKAEISKHKEIGAKESREVKEKFEDLMEQELVCTICNELFIKARSLGCSHTFCEYCIRSWMLRKVECPNCRSPIQSCVRSIVMDNYIDKTVEFLGDEQREYRTKLLAERKVEQEEFDKKESAKEKTKAVAPQANVRPNATPPEANANRGRNVFAINTVQNREANTNVAAHAAYYWANATHDRATAGTGQQQQPQRQQAEPAQRQQARPAQRQQPQQLQRQPHRQDQQQQQQQHRQHQQHQQHQQYNLVYQNALGQAVHYHNAHH